MLLVSEFISKLDGFTYWNAFDSDTLNNISDVELSNNEYEITEVGTINNKIHIYCKKSLDRCKIMC